MQLQTSAAQQRRSQLLTVASSGLAARYVVATPLTARPILVSYLTTTAVIPSLFASTFGLEQIE